jgi:uncharacterized membrane protein (UPF0127 family)
MRRILILIAVFISLSIPFLSPGIARGADPLAVPNNRFGVHIFEVDEIFEAAKLVNSSGGAWGYVTIPIRTDERDNDKWTSFFKHCRENKIIPILRLATFADDNSWTTPSALDLVDFANFLNGLPWPVKNRYIILFNEPNHSKEWGGYVSPREYAGLLIQAKDIFKTRSDDFFLISGGLDMSAPSNGTSLDALKYYREMTKAEPKWYQALDGIGVHAYPNPGFVASPLTKDRYGITSYRYELSTLKSLGFSGKPVFITETGYTGRKDFYPTAFNTVWTEKNIVAITPFVLFAGVGDFVKFSLLDTSFKPTASYMAIFNQKKTAGSPLLNPPPPLVEPQEKSLSFSTGQAPKSSPIANFFSRVLKFFFRPQAQPTLIVGTKTITVELANTPRTRTQGLSGRKNLPENTGMLFEFPEKLIQTFWMKDMNFALDFIWIADGQVVQINEGVPPPSKTSGRPVTITSHQPVDKVLEVNSGFVAEFKIKTGDKVVLNSD